MMGAGLTILDALRSALQGVPQPPQRRQPNNRSVQSYLLQKGFSASIIATVSKNELCYWTQEELDALFSQLYVTPDEVRNGLRSFVSRNRADGDNEMIKPEVNIVAESAVSLGALCVNRAGKFCLNPMEGYAALSHVWSEGLGSDENNRGLDKSLLDQLFDLIEPLEIKWIWTDSLAIPGGNKSLSPEEEEIKAKLINAMSDIYRLAQRVIIIDALVLRLDSVDPLEVAALTCLGSWMTRVWTYQEVKLATNAVIATKAGFVEFRDMIVKLECGAKLETDDDYKITDRGQWSSLLKTFLRLQRNDDLGVSLPDIAFACADRKATDPLDYARAMFPTLGIHWHAGDTIEDAMQRVYEARRRDATRLVLFHGPPRATYPGWAPATFPGLVDGRIIEAGTWKQRGMARKWRTNKIRRIAARKQRQLLLELEVGETSVVRSVGFLSEETVDKSPDSVKEFEISIQNGMGYLLTEEMLTPKQHFSRVGLLVERFTRPVTLEGWVCCTIAMGETEEGYNSEELEWLLLHENPISIGKMKGKEASELYHMLETSI